MMAVYDPNEFDDALDGRRPRDRRDWLAVALAAAPCVLGLCFAGFVSLLFRDVGHERHAQAAVASLEAFDSGASQPGSADVLARGPAALAVSHVTTPSGGLPFDTSFPPSPTRPPTAAAKAPNAPLVLGGMLAWIGIWLVLRPLHVWLSIQVPHSLRATRNAPSTAGAP